MPETDAAPATTARGGKRRAPATAAKGPRLDIQGLRAVAVLLVVAEHLTGWPHGGFIGVDVFFVISGFLITGLLLREHERTGHISFANFYRRRARRILPAATLVLAVTSVAAWLVYVETRAKGVWTDALWSFFFVGNYRFASNDTDYFAATTGASPLQHYWSLSVEEQFYFVWPWLMLLLLAVLAKAGRGHHSRLAVGVTMAAIVVASFLFGLYETTERPTWAYFSTLARVWELGLGALLAICAPLLLSMGRRVGSAVSWLGLGLIVVGALTITADQGFPAPAALLPVLGSALVIAGGTAGPAPYLWPLTNRAMTYVGDISFSLYLWHFPVIVLLAALLPPGTTTYYVCALVVMALASSAAYHAFEKPIHHSRWLEGRAGRERRAAAGASGTPSRGLLRHVAVATAAALACTAVTAAAIARIPEPTVPGQAFLEEVIAGPTDGTEAGAWRVQLAEALLEPDWPELSPSVDDLDRSELVDPWIEDGCLAFEEGAQDDPMANAADCVYGNPEGERTLVLYGDSIGISWLPAIEESVGDDWRIEVYAARQCIPGDLTITNTDGSPYPECSEFREDALAQIAEEQPDVLVVSGQGDARQVPDVPDERTATLELGQSLLRVAPTYAEMSEHVVYLPPPPTARALVDCRTPTSTPASCVQEIGLNPTPWYRSMQQAAQQNGATFVDVLPWFCIPEVGCPSFVDGTPVRADVAHLTDAMSRKMGPVVGEALAPAIDAAAAES
ncbi:acyltransferase family protein [Nocardioides zeae]|uniref:Acyltransferase family protein n=1 Tax=Nocardioides imazamoxiresistens TaxID=3231893 RepID=A0ABU3PWG2_9ACTN|nr:acyltransferase family protein [Nocardioides zeae]MDT9593536.1 acyltransferase family protein [Nocardioides zeae]